MADVAPFPPIDTAEINSPAMVRRELDTFIREAINAHPRSLQKRIGPSEIGTPCTRKLGHKLAGTQAVNIDVDKWRATVGTAVHAWLGAMIERANDTLGDKRFLVEHRVQAGQLAGNIFDGSCDVFDTWTGIVIDWKIPGPTTMKSARAHGPGVTYETQVQVYGAGWARKDYRVRYCAIYMLPAAGNLDDALWFDYPFTPDVATDAMRKATAIARLIEDAGPSIVGMLPTAEDYCSHCPFYLPGATDLAVACPGDPAIHRPPPPAALTMSK